MIVSVDVPKFSEACLWRPLAADMRFIKDVVNSRIAWPADRVILEKTVESEEENLSSPQSVNTNNVNKKCKLLDVCGSGQIVAEGRWSSNDPSQVVHFVPLGPNATRVWVETAKVPAASLWRSTSEMEFIEDAIGTTVAWPTDKVVIL
ncbi:PREDICTED: uncharacterized protein LOC105957165 [Erythranthe guttata]|uniref:uncharacterized protein LOC105957165 n=1 Tax=Erythranthe guttata TaxID=4155 RepID=UPI00064D9D85|nr:PREDICTED: uncharacterized protein LOC105957165 [Erythranthe guttata]|eukprot:XP_012836540.1 PREDICTED: uncharacterized protein LOC105957165 [Erythranthe guttata]